ncbi:flagellar hook-length control protein FliK, partial [Candidatus Aerophobetes bacterium]|nr:flagellar hook-length control protein FliK [Candidatus Aerophobetes bacterium]
RDGRVKVYLEGKKVELSGNGKINIPDEKSKGDEIIVKMEGKENKNTGYKSSQEFDLFQEEKSNRSEDLWQIPNYTVESRETRFKTYMMDSLKQTQLIDQILNKIHLLRQKEETRATFLLKSKEFGDINVHIKLQDSDLLLQIQVSDSKTAQLIQSNFSYLKQSLEKQGLFLKEFNMDFNQNSENSNEGRYRTKKDTNFLFLPDNIIPTDYEENLNLQVNSQSYSINYLV